MSRKGSVRHHSTSTWIRLDVEILGLQVLKRFRQLSRTIHPDKNLHPAAPLAFKVLNHAKEILLANPGKESFTNPTQLFSPSVIDNIFFEELGNTMPKVVKFCKEPKRHGFVSFLVPGLGKERRLAIKSKVTSEQGSCSFDVIIASVFYIFFSGYFDLENIFSDNENKYFLG